MPFNTVNGDGTLSAMWARSLPALSRCNLIFLVHCALECRLLLMTGWTDVVEGVMEVSTPNLRNEIFNCKCV